jgi:hypothetical protein
VFPGDHPIHAYPGNRPSCAFPGHGWMSPRCQGQPFPFLLPSEPDLAVSKSCHFLFHVLISCSISPLVFAGARLIRAMSKSHYFLVLGKEVCSFISGIYTPMRRQSLSRTRSIAIVDASGECHGTRPYHQDNVKDASTVHDSLSLCLASRLVWCQEISVNGNFASCFALC